MNCRKNFVHLTSDERTRLARAFNVLYEQNVIQDFAAEHSNNAENGIHWGPAFLPWHRHFLLRMERELQRIEPNVYLPYWDWTRSDSRDLDAEPWKSFFGGRGANGDTPGEVTTGEFSHWTFFRSSSPNSGGSLPLPPDIVDELQEGSYADYRSLEEKSFADSGSHISGHAWTGGTMAGMESPLDPLFYLHHNNIDRLWAVWQRNNPGVPPYTHTDGRARRQAARVALKDPMVGRATPESMLDHLALGYRYPEDVELEAAWSDEGLGTLLTGDPVEKELLEPVASSGLDFRNVPEGETTWRAAVFSIGACEPVTFEVVSGPTVLTGASGTTFGTPLGTSVVVDPNVASEGRVWISFTGTREGDSATGTVTIRSVETGETWDIDLTATTIRRPTVGTMLVLDRSGSMENDAGDGRRRVDVLKEAAPVFVDLLREDDGVGVVHFDQDAQLVAGLSIAGSASGAGRMAANAAIDAHTPNPTGFTSIGDGIDVAQMALSGRLASSFDETAIVVLTDGRENRPLYIADVAGDIGGRVFGIGLGTAEHINPAALTALTNSTGGYVLMTGTLDTDDQFTLQKYYLQILAGATNANVVLDPEGWLRQGQEHRIPFHVSETDITVDVIALTGDAPSDILRFAVETPSGEVINAGTSGVTIGAGNGLSFYRITLPVPTNAGDERIGTWHAVLLLNEKIYERYLDKLDNDSRRDFPQALLQARTHGIRYSLNVHTTSNLRMQAKMAQNSMEMGAVLTLRAVLEEYGQKVTSRAQVRAEMERPDGTEAELILTEGEPGVFEANVEARLSGVYRFRVLASGRTFRGYPFTREQLLTGAVWSGGDDPFPTSDNEFRKRDERLYDLALCLLRDEAFGRYLEEREIDVDAIRRCVQEFGSEPRQSRKISRSQVALDIEDLRARVLDNPQAIESLTRILREMRGEG